MHQIRERQAHTEKHRRQPRGRTRQEVGRTARTKHRAGRATAERRTGVGTLAVRDADQTDKGRSEEHTSELPSLMRTSYAVFCLKKKKPNLTKHTRVICLM